MLGDRMSNIPKGPELPWVATPILIYNIEEKVKLPNCLKNAVLSAP